MQACMNFCTHTHTPTPTPTHTPTHTHTHLHTHIHLHTYTPTHTHTPHTHMDSHIILKPFKKSCFSEQKNKLEFLQNFAREGFSAAVAS